MRHTYPTRKSNIILFALATFIILMNSLALQGQEWSMTDVDLQTHQVMLKAISPAGVVVSQVNSNIDQLQAWNAFVSVRRPTTHPASAPKFTLLLASDDRLAGEPTGTAKEQLNWVSPSMGNITIPFSRMVSIGRATESTAPQIPPRQDIITLMNGDSVSGIFSDLGSAGVSLQTDSGTTLFPLENVKRIVFAGSGMPARDAGPSYRIHLLDSSIVAASELTLQRDQLQFTLIGKHPLPVTVPIEMVSQIEQVNGPLVWLSSSNVAENVQTPYFGDAIRWPTQFDSAVDGSPIQFNGHVYQHGIGVHAYSRLSFKIDPRWSAFRVQYAIDSRRDAPSRLADVTVKVMIDGKTVHEAKHVRAGELSERVVLDVRGGKTLTLECQGNIPGDVQDHLDWIEPAFLTQHPQSASTMPASPK